MAARRRVRAAPEISFAPTLGDIGTTLSHPATSSHRGLSPEAREALGTLAEQTDRPAVLHALGTITESEGRYSEAREYYETALAQDPENVDALFRLAYQHDLSGDDDAAITLYERARRVKPASISR